MRAASERAQIDKGRLAVLWKHSVATRSSTFSELAEFFRVLVK
jgi:hypothetical protein